MNLLSLILILLFQSSLVFAQSLPNNYFSYQSRKLLHDTGNNWNSLTVFGPIRFKLNPQKELNHLKSSTYFDGQIGVEARNTSYSIYGFGRFKYKNRFFIYAHPVIINNKSKSFRFGNETKFANTQEYTSGIGYENNWAIFQIGKGKESWGAGNEIQLALSEDSGSYDYFLLGSDYGKIRVRYIHGFLENVDDNINRYITARGFEWTNKSSLIIGFSETVIYSGENRSIDIGYLNPMSSHLEIELNDRLNIIGTGKSNAVWQAHLDYLPKKNIRLSLNYLYDEFVLDPGIQIGKEHGKAYSIRFAYSPLFSGKHLLTLYSSLVYVGTPTFRHGNGMNNFVQDGRPLGWQNGSDSQESSFGINYFNNENLIVNIVTGLLQSGDEATTKRIFDPYEDYLRGSFPSGKVEEKTYIETSFIYWWKENYSISGIFHYSKNINTINMKLNIPIFQSFKE